jgi:hypothetical protein
MFKTCLRTIMLCSASFVLLLPGFAQDSTSLGEIARQNRAHAVKKPEKVYTNDDLASVGYNNGAIQGETGNAATKAGSSTTAADDKQDKGKGSEAEKTGNQPAGDTAEGAPVKKGEKVPAAKPVSAEERLHNEYAAKKAELELAQRELNVAQQEYQLQTAHYYGDAGTALRNPQEWASKRKEYEDEIAEKQKQVEAATQALQNMEDEGRKTGISVQ